MFRINTTYKDELFFTYCALLYNQNLFMELAKENEGVNKEILETMVEAHASKTLLRETPSTYFYTVLSTKKYAPTVVTPPEMYKTTIYIKQVSEIARLNEINNRMKLRTKESLEGWQKDLKSISQAVNEFLHIRTKTKQVYVTRNLLEVTNISVFRNAYYIHRAWSDKRLGYGETLYDILNGLLGESDVGIPKEIEKILNKLSEEIKAEYTSVKDFVRDCFIRSLVAYISKKSPQIPPQELSSRSKPLLLPQKFLEYLEGIEVENITAEHLKKIPKQIRI